MSNLANWVLLNFDALQRKLTHRCESMVFVSSVSCYVLLATSGRHYIYPVQSKQAVSLCMELHAVDCKLGSKQGWIAAAILQCQIQMWCMLAQWVARSSGGNTKQLHYKLQDSQQAVSVWCQEWLLVADIRSYKTRSEDPA